MPTHILQVTGPGLAYLVIGGFAVAFTMVSLLVKQKLYINEVVLGTAFGIIFGPYGANIFSPRSWGGDLNAITLEIMRLTLAAGLFTIGVELPEAYLAEHARGLLTIVVPTMALGWFVVAAFVYALFPPLNFISTLVIAACLTPTDPIISAAIVGGKFATKHVPVNLRRIIAAESAANDGLAYPFLSLSIMLTTERPASVAFRDWFLIGCLYQVLLGATIGAMIGYVFSCLMKISHRKGFIDRESYIAQYLALTLFTIGVTRTMGSDDLLAAFAAGSALNWDGYFNSQIEGEAFSSVIDLILNCGAFVYIGAWLPLNMFNAPELGITPWRLVILLIAVLMLRRIPALLVLYKWVPEITSWKEALFAGHFGPMGVGAIFVSTFAVTELPKPHSPPENQAELLAATIQTIVAFVVLGSIVVHGLSIPLFSVGHRTLSITRTWTSRSRNGTPHPPQWLNMVRERSRDAARQDTSPVSTIVEGVDLERGGLKSKAHVDPRGAPEPIVILQTKPAESAQDVPELGTASMITDPVRYMQRTERSVDIAEAGREAIGKGTSEMTATETQKAPAIVPRVDIASLRARVSSLHSNTSDLSEPLSSGVQTPASQGRRTPRSSAPSGEDMNAILMVLRQHPSTPSLRNGHYFDDKEEADVAEVRTTSGKGDTEHGARTNIKAERVLTPVSSRRSFSSFKEGMHGMLRKDPHPRVAQ